MIEFIALVGAVVSASISVPQFLLVLRTKSTKGLSMTPWVISIGTGIGWICHGLRVGEINLAWPSMWGLVVSATLLYYLRRNGHYHSLTKLLPGFALAALLVALDNGLGSVAFGLAVIWPSVYGMMRQGIALMRSPDVTGVSVGAWVLQVLNQAMWLYWAICVHEMGTIISGAVCLGPAIFVLTWRLIRANGAGPAIARQQVAELTEQPEDMALAS